MDVKEVVDGDTLPSDTYEHLKELAKKNVPLYQFTAIDIRTRIRFLAYGQQDSFNNGWAFMILIVLWVRSFGVKHHITMQTDKVKVAGLDIRHFKLFCYQINSL